MATIRKGGHIYKRGNTYWIKYSRNGKPYFESTKSTKEGDANKLLNKRLGEISEGKLPGVYFDRVKFDELAEDVLIDYRINNRKSLDRLELSIQHLKGIFEGMKVTNIDTPRINKYIQSRREEGAANGTINRELAALKRMLKIGANQTPPKVNRVPYISMLKENNVRKGFFEQGDYLALKDALPDYLKGFATFGFKTGWRVSEIKGLTWPQVDLDQGIVRLEGDQTKNEDARTIYLDEELKEIFANQWEARKKSEKLLPYVFPNKNGRGKIKNFYRAWKTALQNAGIGKKLFHDFRRSAIRNMVRAGINERVSMMVSGHKTRSVFDRYNIVNATDLKEAAQKQEAYLEAQTVTKTVTIGDFSKSQEKT